MSETIIAKTCRVCKQTKPISEFHKRSDSKDSHRNNCKSCRRESDNTYHRSEKGKATHKRYIKSEKYEISRKRHQESEKYKLTCKRYQQSEKGKTVARCAVDKYQRRRPEQRKAGNVVNNAIRIGELPRPDTLKCSCGEQAKQYHHPSYAPEHHFDIVPLCIFCHNKLRLTS